MDTSNVSEKTRFSILMAPHHALALLPMDKKVLVKIIVVHINTRLEKGYTPEELENNTYRTSVQK